MTRSFYSGLSGLNVHSRMLDVVGNNLANLNTTAFKARLALISDAYYGNLRSAGTQGTNPVEIGSGANAAQVSKNLSQGNLESTGNELDLAIEGDGFFVADDGNQMLYTRAGAFGRGPSNVLVDPSTGYRIQRTGNVGEPDGVNPAFQTPGDSSIRIPIGAAIPAVGTTAVDLAGNLDASKPYPLAERLTTGKTFTTALGAAPAISTTLLNDLDSNTVDYGGGDSITITGTDMDGSPISTSLAVDATTTLGDLVNAIDTAFTQATASLDAQGNIAVEATATGAAFLSLSLDDAVGNAGATSFLDHALVLTTDGTDGQQYQRSIEVFDELGIAHSVTATFHKQDRDLWDLSFSMDAQDGTIVNNTVHQIRFNDDGSLQRVLGSASPEIGLDVQFAGTATAQDIQVSLGTANAHDGLTHTAVDTAFNVEQNGMPPGVLVSANVSANGLIEGTASNGRTVPLAQLAIASFSNIQGLSSRGGNYYEMSLSSGSPQIGTGLTTGRGAVRASVLESSNVDLALEFTRLIVAQRGFSANARTIAITGEVMDELTTLIR